MRNINFLNARFLVFLIILALIIAGAIIITFFYLRSKGQSITAAEPERAEIKKCLLHYNLGPECDKFFADPSNAEICHGLGELKDKCFYKMASDGRLDLCGRIDNLLLRNECEKRGAALIEPIGEK